MENTQEDCCHRLDVNKCDFCGANKCEYHGKWIENIFYCEDHSCWKCLSNEALVLLNLCSVCGHIFCDEHGHSGDDVFEEDNSCSLHSDHCFDCCEKNE